jgi:hypothetical protein
MTEASRSSPQFALTLNHIQEETTMRMTIFAAIAAIGFGFVGSSTVSAAPAYGTSMGAAAVSLDLRQEAYAGRHRYYGYGSYRRYRHCFQDCPGHQG